MGTPATPKARPINQKASTTGAVKKSVTTKRKAGSSPKNESPRSKAKSPKPKKQKKVNGNEEKQQRHTERKWSKVAENEEKRG